MAASWHVAAAMPTVRWLEVVTAARLVQRDFLADPLTLRDGDVGLPTAPGLGVRLDRDLLEKYRFVPGSGERT
jgi:L-alanine-DL-glutamate epimerase-like enolase superfamily enzyme